MWKALTVGTTMLTIAGSTLASAQQPSPAERSHHAQLTADDIAAIDREGATRSPNSAVSGKPCSALVHRA